MYPSTEGALAPHVPLGEALPNDYGEERDGACLILLGRVGACPRLHLLRPHSSWSPPAIDNGCIWARTEVPQKGSGGSRFDVVEEEMA